MGKSSKIIGALFLVLGIVSIGMYFVMGDKFTNSKVVFDSDGGTLVQDQIVKKGEKVVKPTDPTKENNEFVEWQLNGVKYNFDNAVTNDITLKAKWNLIVKHSVKVTLDGEEYTADIRDGEKVTVEDLKIPTKAGYLIKFYKSEDEEFDLSTPIKEDLELNATYVEIKTYTVKFNSNGGTKVDDVKVNEGNTILAPTVTRDGYILDGWYIGEEKFDFKTPITKNLTLKARWNDGPRINVTFMVDGSVYKTIAAKENSTVSKPSNPTKKGYRFVEWQLNGKTFDFKTKITNEITLTALFEEVTSYKVTFNSNGGSSVSSQEVTSKVTKPANPTRNGYIFVEWQLNGKKFDFNSTISDDIELKAYWEKEKPKYTVTFNGDDDKKISSQIVEEGKTATKPTDPTKEGYQFTEWLYNHATFDFTTPITQDIVLTARFERIVDNNPDVNSDKPSGDVLDDEK